MSTQLTDLFRLTTEKTIASALSQAPLFPGQQRVLAESPLLPGGNLLYLAPTGAGKSLVAEALLPRHLTSGGKAVFLVSTRTLARERHSSLANRLGPLGYRVVLSTRDDRTDDDTIRRGEFDVLVTVYEKGASLLQQAAPLRHHVTLLVADELQLAEDPERGPGVQSLLSAWRLLARPEVVGLSAHMERPDEIANSMDLLLWREEERPVPLRIGAINLRTGEAIQRDHEAEAERQFPFSWQTAEELLADAPSLLDAFPKPILFFVATKRQAWQLAHQLAERRSLQEDSPLPESMDSDSETAHLLRHGVGLHCSDLCREERHAVEQQLRDGKLEVCVATATLAEGLNLPVRTVLVAPGPWPGGVQQLENCLGRVGRPGQEELGEAWLLHWGDQRPIWGNFPPVGRIVGSQELLQQALFRIAFCLSLGLRTDDLPPLIYPASSPGMLPDKIAIEKGMQLGFWKPEGAVGDPVLTSFGEIFATGGLPWEAVCGWRTHLRRFPSGGGDGATSFLVLGAGGGAKSLPLTHDERLSGRWVAELTTLLHEENTVLAHYFLDYLATPERLPRSLHLAAKGTMALLDHRKGERLGNLARRYQVTSGVLEEYLEFAEYLHAQADRVARLLGGAICGQTPPTKTHTREKPLHHSGREQARVVNVEPVAPPPQPVPMENVQEVSPRLILRRGATGEVELDGATVRLTRIQFRMLELLAHQAGRGIPYERLENYVWTDAQVERQQVAFHRRRLEARLQEASPQASPYLETHAAWGICLQLQRGQVVIAEERPEAAFLRDCSEVLSAFSPLNPIAWPVCV